MRLRQNDILGVWARALDDIYNTALDVRVQTSLLISPIQLSHSNLIESFPSLSIPQFIPFTSTNRQQQIRQDVQQIQHSRALSPRHNRNRFNFRRNRSPEL